MPQRKKAGCNSYASVTDEYTLYNKEASTVVAPSAPSAPPTTTKGGVRRRGGNTTSTSNTPSLTGALSSIGVNTPILSQGMSGLFGTADATPTPPTQPVTGGNRRSKRGGSSSCSATRYGGFYEDVASQNSGLDTVANMLTNTTKSVSDSLFGAETAKTGGSRHRRGGAVELAPFAASLAFLAARMSMDDKLNFSKLLNLKNNKDDETDEEVEYEETKSKGSRSKNSRD